MSGAIENAIFYAARKSEQDMPTALQACTEDFELVAPAFGAVMKGRAENLKGMAQFFQLFPDYKVELVGALAAENYVLMSGHVSMTPNFALLGVKAEAQTARIAFSATFETRNALLSRETFVIDLVELCEQSGLPLTVALKVANRKVRLHAA